MAGSSSRSAYADVPYNDRRTVWMYARSKANSAREFGEMHELHAWALPFEGHVIDPTQLLSDVGEYLEGRPPYCQRVTKAPLADATSVNGVFWENTYLLEMTMLVHGWWLGGKSSVGRYFCNPNYTHRHPRDDTITDWGERREKLETAASLGLIMPSQLAPMFGHRYPSDDAGNAVSKVAHRLEFPWGVKREAGWRRMGRTWKTLNEWDHSYREIAGMFGTSKSVVAREIRRVPEFEPPTDPTVGVLECL